MDILVKIIETNDSCYTEQRKDENYCLNRGHKLFISENWLEVVKVNHDIASILFFRIYVLLSSKSIRFDT